MATKKRLSPAEAVQPIIMNGLQGRMLHLPAAGSRSREILLIYGHHANIERMYSLAEELNKYGSVTLPDLPGFGGMESFYKISKTPTLDNMADYLAAFVKMRYSRKNVTIIGISYGFLVATRMLQRYPELSKKVSMLVSLVGFAHYEDFHFKPSNRRLLATGANVLSHRFPAWFIKTFLLRGPLIKATYLAVADRHVKMKDASREERNRRIRFEIILWKCNDLRTHLKTSAAMLTVNLCNSRVQLPVHHVAVDGDQYFDNFRIEQHMRVIFTDFILYKSQMNAHMPTIVATAKEVAPLIPPALRRILAKN